MKLRDLSIVISGLTLLLLATGVAGAIPNRAFSSPATITAEVASGITYQGRLTDASGMILDGTYTMRFVIYDAAAAGTALWDSGNLDIAVEEGLFTVALGVDQADFDGQELWLSILIEGQTLSPRQQLLPAPYALGLRPGVDIRGESITDEDAILAGYAPVTGAAFYGSANGGTAIIGSSAQNFGVWGSSANSWGGYFTSEGGYGIRVESDGTAHFDHGAYITAVGGYGAYVQSAQNQGVRAEAGDITGIAQPLGAIGVAGIGQSRGMYGASADGIGVYGNSEGNYGVWGQSSNFRGVTGRTSRPDNNYGVYTPDNLFAANVNLAGAVMQVMQNNGTTPLSPGDVVVFSGVTVNKAYENMPMAQVSLANAANSAAVAGVVFSRFNLEAIDSDEGFPNAQAAANEASMEVTPAGDAPPGDYVLVVVQGVAQVKASAVASGSIAPGDLLSTSSAAGTATQATTLSINGVESALPGTVFAKALEALDDAQAMIYVYVTLQ